MAQLNPYLNFNGQCREAMTFYKNCLGGELFFQTIAETPMAAQMPAEMKDNIVHAELKNNNLVIMASDITRGNPVEGNTIHLMLNCGSEEEINNAYTKLAEGGTVLEPLKEQFWGDIFGSVTDKFGKSWMFNYHKN